MVLAVEPEGLLLDVNGVIGQCHVPELTLSGDQVPSDRYAVGDTVEAFIWQIGPDERVLYLSVRRNAPGYVDALNALSVGFVVSATVTGFEGSGGLWLDIGGVVGGISLWELSFADAESTQSRYTVGDTVDDLFVWQVDHNQRSLGLSIRRNMPSYVDALNTHSVGDIVSGIVINVIDDALALDVSGVIGSVGPHELFLAYGESAQDRYAVGDTVHDLLVWQVDHDVRDLDLSVRRNAPSYVEALNTYSVGDVVSATIAAFEGRRIWLDVDGVIGDMSPWDLPLFGTESAQNHYAVGDTILDLFVWQVNRDDRALGLSARHSLPGYVKALNAYSVGDIVSATVVEFQGDGGLWLDAGGVIGNVEPRELSLADGESAQDHYAVGDIVDKLFVRWVNRDARMLALSVRRNASGYIEAFNEHSIGDVVSATATGRQVDGGLWLEVGGVIGGLPPWELPLADDESAQDHYTAGDIVHDLFVWQVNHSDREIVLSARRNAPGYIKALANVSVGDHLDGTVAKVYEEGLWLDAAGVFGWLPAQEMQIDKDQSPPMRYADGDSIKACVWQIDWASRTVIFSLRHLGRDSF